LQDVCTVIVDLQKTITDKILSEHGRSLPTSSGEQGVFNMSNEFALKL